MTQAELLAEFKTIRKVFRFDILPSLDAVKPLLGESMPRVVRRLFDRLDVALTEATSQLGAVGVALEASQKTEKDAWGTLGEVQSILARSAGVAQ